MPERKAEMGFFWIALFLLAILLIVMVLFLGDALNMALHP